MRGGLRLRGRRSPAHPRRWSVRWGVDRRTLPAARIGRPSSRSERSRAAACRPAARVPDRPRHGRRISCARLAREPGPHRRGRVALAGNPRCARYPDGYAAGLGTPTDSSDGPVTASGNATIEAREAIARCGRLGSARVALGSAHGRRGEDPAPGETGAAPGWPVGGSRGGPWRPPASRSGTRAERAVRGGLRLRGRRSPADPRRWSVRWGVDWPTLPAARIGRASSRSERSRAAACRPAARVPDRPRHGRRISCARLAREPGPHRRGRVALAGNPRCARYPAVHAAGLACRPTIPTDRSPPRATRRSKRAKP